MTDAPDQIWIDAEYWECRGWNAALLKAAGGNYNYLRATPARLNAEELVKVLQEIVDDLPWLIVAMGDWDAGGPEGVLRLHEIADRSLGLLGWIEGEKP